MLLFNSKVLLRQWKPCDAAVNFDTYWNLQRNRAVLPAIARHLVSIIAASCATINEIMSPVRCFGNCVCGGLSTFQNCTPNEYYSLFLFMPWC